MYLRGKMPVEAFFVSNTPRNISTAAKSPRWWPDGQREKLERDQARRAAAYLLFHLIKDSTDKAAGHRLRGPRTISQVIQNQAFGNKRERETSGMGVR